jgi:hypothetical protein
MEKLRIVTLLARRNRKWSLNDGRIPSPNVVRVAPVSGYHRVEENRRASRNSLRERSPTRNPLRYDSPLSHRCTPAGPPATVGDSDRRRRSPPPRERGERHHQRSPPPRHHGRSPPRRQRSPSPRGSGGGGGGERTKVNPKTGTAGTYQGCWEALCGTGRALPVPVSDWLIGLYRAKSQIFTGIRYTAPRVGWRRDETPCTRREQAENTDERGTQGGCTHRGRR